MAEHLPVTPSSPEAIPLTNWLVGPYSYDRPQEPGMLQPWQVPFHDIALGGLRRISGIQRDEPLPADFQPDPLKGAELYRELAPDRKLHGMMNSLQAYIHDYKTGTVETKLRNHQIKIMDVLADTFTKVGVDRQINIKSPTGTGKTAILTTLVEALKYKEQPNDKVRALVLLPTKDILGQTVTAFEKFTDIKAEKYFGESKKIGDVTAMTYQSFRAALERGDINQDSFDVVVRDEADTFSRGKGKTTKLIDNYCYNPETGRNKLVVGLTATPHESQTTVYERTIVQSIGDGLLAPLATYQRRTGVRVKEDSDRDWREDFKQSEVEHLMFDEARNEIIVDEIISGLISGRRVLARCLPGHKLAHPGIINELIKRRGRVKIKHPYMGDVERRPVRSLIIPGTMSMRDRELLTKVYNNERDERIDVFLIIATLIRGFDSPVTKKVINGAPSRSPALVEQLLGRAVRPYTVHGGNTMTAQAVDIVDETDSEQVTFRDIINRNAPSGMRYKKGSIIGPGLANLYEVNEDNQFTPGSAFEPVPLQEKARALNALLSSGFVDFEGVDLRTANPNMISGEFVDKVIGAAALVGTAKLISDRQAEGGRRVELDSAAEALGVSVPDLMTTARDLRIGLEKTSLEDHFFSSKAFARLRAHLQTKKTP